MCYAERRMIAASTALLAALKKIFLFFPGVPGGLREIIISTGLSNPEDVRGCRGAGRTFPPEILLCV